MIFGSRQERFVPADASHPQLALDLNAALVGASTVVNTQQITYKRQTVVTTPEPLIHPGRMKLPECLRWEVFLIEPAEGISGCKKIQEEITEVLEYEPGELYVKQYRRPQYARPGGEGVVIGQLPSRALPKAMAGEGLLAQIVIDKYVDHLPLYRQMQRFERTGLKLPYSTITDWVSGTCQLAEFISKPSLIPTAAWPLPSSMTVKQPSQRQIRSMTGYYPSLNHQIPLLRILTDRGTEYNGKSEHHEYELYLQIEGIDHTKTQVRHPQTNGICERLRRTMQEEFYAVTFRKKLYDSIDDLQADLDAWIEYYNNERPHSGRYCFGKTPMQTFIESLPLAKEKLLNDLHTAA